MPKVDVKIYTGSSKDAAIVRSQENELISCSSPNIEKFRCLTGEDLMKIYEAFFLCKEWKPNTEMMSTEMLIEFYSSLRGVK